MSSAVIVYLFQVRGAATEKWQFTKTPITVEEARDQYGVGNFRILLSTKQVRESDKNETTGVQSVALEDRRETERETSPAHVETVATPAESLIGPSVR